jgi:glycosyltransferase involved in cell wall biosynthesis
MKILHLNTFEQTGGAAIAANRIHKGLLQQKINSTYRVASKMTQSRSVLGPQKPHEIISLLLQHELNNLPTLKYRSINSDYCYSPGYFPGIGINRIKYSKPDIINLHWISDGFIRIETLAKITCPIVWTLHDSWAFTGGCHIPFDCNRYVKNCGKCPALGSSRSNDLSSKVLLRKIHAWEKLNITIVAPSRWMADCAKKSLLFRNHHVKVIPNGIDTSCFKPHNRKIVRDILNLPPDKKIILFGGNNVKNYRNKGFQMLKESLKKLASTVSQEEITIVVFGEANPEPSFGLNFETKNIGMFKDEVAMAIVYSSADAIVVPSIQESFGLTAAEALSCGTPVIAFDTSGLKDVVDHMQNGYLAKPFETDDLAKGIAWVLEDENRWKSLSVNARKKVEQSFSIKTVVKKYTDLYTEILG